MNVPPGSNYHRTRKHGLLTNASSAGKNFATLNINQSVTDEMQQMDPSNPPHPFGPRSSLLRSKPSKHNLLRKTSQQKQEAPLITVEISPPSVPVTVNKRSKRKLHSVVERLTRRATKVRDEIAWDEPPSASSSDEDDAHSSPSGADSPTKSALTGETSEAKAERERRQRAERQDEFRKRLEALAANDMRIPPPADKNAKPFSETVELWGPYVWQPPAWLEKHYPHPFSSQTNYKFITWLAVVSAAFLYNTFAFPLRTLFDYDKDVPLWVWILLDFLSDLINVMDLVLVQPLVKFPERGIFSSRRRDTMLHYVRSKLFVTDAIAAVPIDYIVWATGAIDHGKIYALLRIGRLCKFSSYNTFFDRLDMTSSVPNALRVVKTMLYMVFLLHCNGGIYYVLSKYEHTNDIYNIWTYNGKEIAYIRCFFYAVKTGTDIGNNNPPLSVLERFFMTFCWLSGVFIFATLIEQIHGIIENIHEREDEYRNKMNETIHYLQKMDVPRTTQERVKNWFAFNWKFQKTLNENEFIEILPLKLKQDVALTVHYETLAKVELFQDCETELVRDLVLRLTPRLYLPGDLICKKGEVGREMFIIKYGYVEVVGGPNNSTVFVTLGEGTVFGEIALLAVGGGNRRTADVKSKGLSQLFVLKKHDLEAVIGDYPIAQRVLHKKAKRLVRAQKLKDQQAAAEAVVAAGGVSVHSRQPKVSEADSIQPPHQTMADIVVQLLPVASDIRRRLSSFPPSPAMIARSATGMAAAVAQVSPNSVDETQNDFAIPKRVRKRTVASRKSSSSSRDENQNKADFSSQRLSRPVVNPALPMHASVDDDYTLEDMQKDVENDEIKKERSKLEEEKVKRDQSQADAGFVGIVTSSPVVTSERSAIYPLPPPPQR